MNVHHSDACNARGKRQMIFKRKDCKYNNYSARNTNTQTLGDELFRNIVPSSCGNITKLEFPVWPDS